MPQAHALPENTQLNDLIACVEYCRDQHLLFLLYDGLNVVVQALAHYQWPLSLAQLTRLDTLFLLMRDHLLPLDLPMVMRHQLRDFIATYSHLLVQQYRDTVLQYLASAMDDASLYSHLRTRFDGLDKEESPTAKLLSATTYQKMKGEAYTQRGLIAPQAENEMLYLFECLWRVAYPYLQTEKIALPPALMAVADNMVDLLVRLGKVSTDEQSRYLVSWSAIYHYFAAVRETALAQMKRYEPAEYPGLRVNTLSRTPLSSWGSLLARLTEQKYWMSCLVDSEVQLLVTEFTQLKNTIGQIVPLPTPFRQAHSPTQPWNPFIPKLAMTRAVYHAARNGTTSYFAAQKQSSIQTIALLRELFHVSSDLLGEPYSSGTVLLTGSTKRHDKASRSDFEGIAVYETPAGGASDKALAYHLSRVRLFELATISLGETLGKTVALRWDASCNPLNLDGLTVVDDETTSLVHHPLFASPKQVFRYLRKEVDGYDLVLVSAIAVDAANMRVEQPYYHYDNSNGQHAIWVKQRRANGEVDTHLVTDAQIEPTRLYLYYADPSIYCRFKAVDGQVHTWSLNNQLQAYLPSLRTALTDQKGEPELGQNVIDKIFQVMEGYGYRSAANTVDKLMSDGKLRSLVNPMGLDGVVSPLAQEWNEHHMQPFLAETVSAEKLRLVYQHYVRPDENVPMPHSVWTYRQVIALLMHASVLQPAARDLPNKALMDAQRPHHDVSLKKYFYQPLGYLAIALDLYHDYGVISVPEMFDQAVAHGDLWASLGDMLKTSLEQLGLWRERNYQLQFTRVQVWQQVEEILTNDVSYASPLELQVLRLLYHGIIEPLNRLTEAQFIDRYHGRLDGMRWQVPSAAVLQAIVEAGFKQLQALQQLQHQPPNRERGLHQGYYLDLQGLRRGDSVLAALAMTPETAFNLLCTQFAAVRDLIEPYVTEQLTQPAVVQHLHQVQGIVIPQNQAEGQTDLQDDTQPSQVTSAVIAYRLGLVAAAPGAAEYRVLTPPGEQRDVDPVLLVALARLKNVELRQWHLGYQQKLQFYPGLPDDPKMTNAERTPLDLLYMDDHYVTQVHWVSCDPRRGDACYPLVYSTQAHVGDQIDWLSHPVMQACQDVPRAAGGCWRQAIEDAEYRQGLIHLLRVPATQRLAWEEGLSCKLQLDDNTSYRLSDALTGQLFQLNGCLKNGMPMADAADQALLLEGAGHAYYLHVLRDADQAGTYLLWHQLARDLGFRVTAPLSMARLQYTHLEHGTHRRWVLGEPAQRVAASRDSLVEVACLSLLLGRARMRSVVALRRQKVDGQWVYSWTLPTTPLLEDEQAVSLNDILLQPSLAQQALPARLCEQLLLIEPTQWLTQLQTAQAAIEKWITADRQAVQQAAGRDFDETCHLSFSPSAVVFELQRVQRVLRECAAHRRRLTFAELLLMLQPGMAQYTWAAQTLHQQDVPLPADLFSAYQPSEVPDTYDAWEESIAESLRVETVAKSLQHLALLNHLDLARRNQMGEVDNARQQFYLELLQALSSKDVACLDFSGSEVTDAQLSGILPHFPGLTTLYLQRCGRLTRDGLRQVSQHPHLEALYLDGGPFTSLVVTPHVFPKLRLLSLANLFDLTSLRVADGAPLQELRVYNTRQLRVTPAARFWQFFYERAQQQRERCLPRGQVGVALSLAERQQSLQQALDDIAWAKALNGSHGRSEDTFKLDRLERSIGHDMARLDWQIKRRSLPELFPRAVLAKWAVQQRAGDDAHLMRSSSLDNLAQETGRERRLSNAPPPPAPVSRWTQPAVEQSRPRLTASTSLKDLKRTASFVRPPSLPASPRLEQQTNGLTEALSAVAAHYRVSIYLPPLTTTELSDVWRQALTDSGLSLRSEQGHWVVVRYPGSHWVVAVIEPASASSAAPCLSAVLDAQDQHDVLTAVVAGFNAWCQMQGVDSVSSSPGSSLSPILSDIDASSVTLLTGAKATEAEQRDWLVQQLKSYPQHRVLGGAPAASAAQAPVATQPRPPRAASPAHLPDLLDGQKLRLLQQALSTDPADRLPLADSALLVELLLPPKHSVTMPMILGRSYGKKSAIWAWLEFQENKIAGTKEGSWHAIKLKLAHEYATTLSTFSRESEHYAQRAHFTACLHERLVHLNLRSAKADCADLATAVSHCIQTTVTALLSQYSVVTSGDNPLSLAVAKQRVTALRQDYTTACDYYRTQHPTIAPGTVEQVLLVVWSTLIKQLRTQAAISQGHGLSEVWPQSTEQQRRELLARSFSVLRPVSARDNACPLVWQALLQQQWACFDVLKQRPEVVNQVVAQLCEQRAWPWFAVLFDGEERFAQEARRLHEQYAAKQHWQYQLQIELKIQQTRLATFQQLHTLRHIVQGQTLQPRARAQQELQHALEPVRVEFANAITQRFRDETVTYWQGRRIEKNRAPQLWRDAEQAAQHELQEIWDMFRLNLGLWFAGTEQQLSKRIAVIEADLVALAAPLAQAKAQLTMLAAQRAAWVASQLAQAERLLPQSCSPLPPQVPFERLTAPLLSAARLPLVYEDDQQQLRLLSQYPVSYQGQMSTLLHVLIQQGEWSGGLLLIGSGQAHNLTDGRQQTIYTVSAPDGQQLLGYLFARQEWLLLSRLLPQLPAKVFAKGSVANPLSLRDDAGYDLLYHLSQLSYQQAEQFTHPAHAAVDYLISQGAIPFSAKSEQASTWLITREYAKTDLPDDANLAAHARQQLAQRRLQSLQRRVPYLPDIAQMLSMQYRLPPSEFRLGFVSALRVLAQLFDPSQRIPMSGVDNGKAFFPLFMLCQVTFQGKQVLTRMAAEFRHVMERGFMDAIAHRDEGIVIRLIRHYSTQPLPMAHLPGYRSRQRIDAPFVRLLKLQLNKEMGSDQRPEENALSTTTSPSTSPRQSRR